MKDPIYEKPDKKKFVKTVPGLSEVLEVECNDDEEDYQDDYEEDYEEADYDEDDYDNGGCDSPIWDENDENDEDGE